MIALLIVAHAPLATALKAVAAHAYPEARVPLHAIDVQPDDSPEEIERRLRSVLSEGDMSWLVLSDAFGATPFNLAQRVCEDYPARHVTGVNVPMLWRTLCYGGDALEGVAERAYAGGRDGVMPVNLSRPQNQSIEITRHVASDHHHQQ